MANTNKTDENKKPDHDDVAGDTTSDIVDAEVVQEEPGMEMAAEEIEIEDSDPVATDSDAAAEEIVDAAPLSEDDAQGNEDESDVTEFLEADDVHAEETLEPVTDEEPEETEIQPEADLESLDVPAEKNEQPTAIVPPAPVVHEKIIERKGGFMPMLTGGLIAGAIGFGAGQYVNQAWPFEGDTAADPYRAETTAAIAETTSALTDNTAAIAELANRVDATEGGLNSIDLSPLAEIDVAKQSVATASGQIEGLAGDLAALAVRLETLEKRPVTESVSPDAIAAYERGLDQLRLAMEGQRVEIENMAREAVAAEQGAQEQAQLAAARSALADLISAADDGSPFASALNELAKTSGITAPEALTAVAAEGLVTQSQLMGDFPTAARSALSASRGTVAEDQTGAARFTSFFRDQLGARSVTPRDGQDPDAVLSRAEASVKNGEIAQALTEIAALPESGQAELAEWASSAETRLAALQAIDTLTQELNSK